jgi:hypothetical protein
MSNDKEGRKTYGLLPPKIEESDIVTLGHGFCGSGGSHLLYVERTIAIYDLF